MMAIGEGKGWRKSTARAEEERTPTEGQVRDGLPKVHGLQQVEAGSQGPTAEEAAVRQLQGILN